MVNYLLFIGILLVLGIIGIKLPEKLFDRLAGVVYGCLLTAMVGLELCWLQWLYWQLSWLRIIFQ